MAVLKQRGLLGRFAKKARNIKLNSHTKGPIWFHIKIAWRHQIINDRMFDTIGYSGSICDIVLRQKAFQTQSDLFPFSKSSTIFT